MSNARTRWAATLAIIAWLAVASSWIVSCGGPGGAKGTFGGSTTGTITTSITDPLVCSAAYDHIWVTITKVQANTSSTAGPTDTGWVTLVDLTNSPQQFDLLSLGGTSSCTLTQLGTTSGLKVGNYQQIRVYVLDNAATSGPSPNNCGTSAGFNCVVPHGKPAVELQVGAASPSGIPIAFGQIAGGGANLTAGKDADVNIAFDSCASVLPQATGQFRLKAVLHAGVVAMSNNSISGKVVSGTASTPVAAATVLVESPDSTGIDRVQGAVLTGTDGTFAFCPLASGNYDVVADAATPGPGTSTTVYGPTVAFKVPVGTALGNVPLISVGSSAAPLWASITGQVISAGSGGATPADITLTAVEQATPAGGSSLLVTIPLFFAIAQPPTVTTVASPPTGIACPSGQDCFNYSLMVPPTNPQVGTFSSGSITYTPPASGGLYGLLGETPDCTASNPTPAFANTLAVSPGTATTVSTFAFLGCTAPM